MQELSTNSHLDANKGECNYSRWIGKATEIDLQPIVLRFVQIARGIVDELKNRIENNVTIIIMMTKNAEKNWRNFIKMSIVVVRALIHDIEILLGQCWKSINSSTFDSWFLKENAQGIRVCPAKIERSLRIYGLNLTYLLFSSNH